MGLVYSYMNSKSLVILLSETINILRNVQQQQQQKTKKWDSPREFYHRFMYKVPSYEHSLLTFKLPFKVILSKFEVVF